MKVVEDRVFHWIKVGAQPSDSVSQILKKTGTLGRYDRFLKGESADILKAEAGAMLMLAEKVSPKTRIGRNAKARTTPFKKKEK